MIYRIVHSTDDVVRMTDIDATLTPLIPRFETDTKLLQAIGHLIQWVADHILFQISNIRKLPPELDEISTSRQLLLIIKVRVIKFCNLL